MAIFNSYVSLPEAIFTQNLFQEAFEFVWETNHLECVLWTSYRMGPSDVNFIFNKTMMVSPWIL